MRSLNTKLTLSFVGVAIVATILTLIIVTYSTFNGFDQFIDELVVATAGAVLPPPPPPRAQDTGWKVDRPPRRFEANTPAGNFEDSVYRGIATGLGIGVLLALGVGIALARQLIQPLRTLTTATHALADGALGHQVPVTTQDEIGELTRAFNQMSHDLAHAEQLRQQMTADIAHDLRTPLTVIAGYTEGLSEGKIKQSPQTYRVMNQQVQLLQHLLDDLRLLSLSDAGKLSLDKRPTDPRALLERTAVAYFPQAEAQGVTLSVVGDGNLPLVAVDVDRMVQVLNNLVSNALRFTAAGEKIELRVATKNHHILMQVRDTGRGIPAQDLPHIFERFYRADSARSRAEQESSGLGLAIAKAIVERHGGTIAVSSVIGAGTTFSINLPL